MLLEVPACLNQPGKGDGAKYRHADDPYVEADENDHRHPLLEEEDAQKIDCYEEGVAAEKGLEDFVLLRDDAFFQRLQIVEMSCNV